MTIASALAVRFSIVNSGSAQYKPAKVASAASNNASSATKPIRRHRRRMLAAKERKLRRETRETNPFSLCSWSSGVTRHYHQADVAHVFPSPGLKATLSPSDGERPGRAVFGELPDRT